MGVLVLGALISILRLICHIIDLLDDGIKKQLREELTNLSPALGQEIGTTLSVLDPFFSIVNMTNHKILFRFSTDLVHTTGKLIRALGAGSVDYSDKGFEVFQNRTMPGITRSSSITGSLKQF